jgi:DNA-binding transcriptional ArsR family regulator
MMFGGLMSSSEEDSYSMVFTSLKHPIRRKILRILSSEAQTFSDLQKQFKIESSHLTYHIDGLGNLLYKTEDGKYALSSLGEAAVSMMRNVEEPLNTSRFPFTLARSNATEKKFIRRSVVLGLGILCVVLVIGLIGTVSLYAFQTSSLNSKVSDLTDIANLNKSTVWVNDTTITQTASNYTSWFFIPMYAGYVSVDVLSSTTSNTYVRVIYVFAGVNYDNQITVGVSGTGVFPLVYRYTPPPQNTPLLPLLRPPLEIRVGNTNSVGNATETVTITYYY